MHREGQGSAWPPGDVSLATQQIVFKQRPLRGKTLALTKTLGPAQAGQGGPFPGP